MTIRFSLFENSRDAMPKPAVLSWEDFARSLGPHDYTLTSKDALPAFSPAEYRAGTARLARNVVRVSFGVLDLDKISGQQLLSVCRTLEQYNAVLYTTWSHSERVKSGLWCVRACVELTRPVEPGEWRLFWPALASHFGNLTDPQCKDPNRIYYGPFAPPGTEQDAEFFIFRGAPLDVDKLSTARIVTATPTGTDKIPRDRLERLAARWKRSREEWRSTMGEKLTRLVKGEPFAEAGDVDTSIFQLAQDLAAAFPNAQPQSIAEHFGPSLQLMAYGAAPHTVEQVTDKIARALNNQAAELIAEQEAEVIEKRLRMRQAFAHIDPTRDFPYTEPELDSMAASLDCSRDEMQKRWIIQRGNLFYVLGPLAKYSEPYTERDVINAILRDLAPAQSAGVELWSRSATGEPMRKGIVSLMAEYGTVAANYVLDLRAQEGKYVAPEKLFVEAPCPLRPLTPSYDRDVAAWLEILCGPESIGHVLNWISLITDLDSPCAALMLTGAGGTGKSLLAQGLARLWTKAGPTTLASAMDKFNDSITHCPLVFGDETLPKDFRGHGRTEEIRAFIADQNRHYNKKNMPETRLLGAIRLMIAANNKDILAIQSDLSVNDIEAIGDRFCHVPVRPEAIEYLKLCDTKSFVQGDKIARHALWLREHYPTVRSGRFLVKTLDRTFYRALTTKTGIRSALCQWLVCYIKDPRKVDTKGEFGVRVKGQRLYVTTQGILSNWEQYVQNEQVPKTGQLSSAITGLCVDGPRAHLAKPLGGSAHYREIDREHLYAWSQETDYATREEIDAALSVDTEDRGRINARPGA